MLLAKMKTIAEWQLFLLVLILIMKLVIRDKVIL